MKYGFPLHAGWDNDRTIWKGFEYFRENVARKNMRYKIIIMSPLLIPAALASSVSR